MRSRADGARMHTFAGSLQRLLSLLRCPRCRHDGPLETREGPARRDVAITQHTQHLHCRQCGAEFAVTDDLIPLMWDAGVERVYQGQEFESALAANLAVYDDISDNYQAFTRKSDAIATRMRNAVRRVLQHWPQTQNPPPNGGAHRGLYHLDFGCGPGHVLGWLKDFGFIQIGLDISLRNLRNARRNTGCLVVCGSATEMPFRDHSVNLVTESSVLHHVEDWHAVLREAARVCQAPGGVVLDSEPSSEQMAWSRLAVGVFNSRFLPYKLLSYVRRDKYIFRNVQQARLNCQAEIHHQPGTGFPVDRLKGRLEESGLRVDVILSPTPGLESKARPDWKNVLLSLLSARNPWDPRYGPFTAIGVPVSGSAPSVGADSSHMASRPSTPPAPPGP